MPEEIMDAKTDAAPSPVSNNDELIGTMEEPVVPSLEEAPKTDEKVVEESKEEPKEESKEDSQDRFDKHPRFQELIKTKNELKKEMEALKAKVEAKESKKEPEYKDISTMDDIEIQEWMDENPKEYQANLIKQIRADVAKEIRDELTRDSQESRTLKTFEDYAASNESFDPMWESGEIQAFMNENPGHNAISAHAAMTMDDRIKEAVEKARKETEAEVIKRFKAKKGAQVLGSGPASTGTSQGKVAPELKDPKKFGGITTVLAERLAARRRAG